MIRENSRVAFTGGTTNGVVLGDQGTVVALDGAVAHVRWASGGQAGTLVPVYGHDLVATALGIEHDVDDSLEVGSLTTFSARRTYDEGGDVGVVNMMAEQGHLASFADIAEEALGLVEARVRREPSFQAVLADLDDEEGERVLRLASACLIRDAFGTEVE